MPNVKFARSDEPKVNQIQLKSKVQISNETTFFSSGYSNNRPPFDFEIPLTFEF